MEHFALVVVAEKRPSSDGHGIALSPHVVGQLPEDSSHVLNLPACLHAYLLGGTLSALASAK